MHPIAVSYEDGSESRRWASPQYGRPARPSAMCAHPGRDGELSQWHQLSSSARVHRLVRQRRRPRRHCCMKRSDRCSRSRPGVAALRCQTKYLEKHEECTSLGWPTCREFWRVALMKQWLGQRVGRHRRQILISHRHDPSSPTALRCGRSDRARYTKSLTDPNTHESPAFPFRKGGACCEGRVHRCLRRSL